MAPFGPIIKNLTNVFNYPVIEPGNAIDIYIVYHSFTKQLNVPNNFDDAYNNNNTPIYPLAYFANFIDNKLALPDVYL